MRARQLFPWLIAAACLLARPVLGFELVHWASPSTNGMRDLAPFLENYRRQLEFPALAAAVVHHQKISAAGVAGERKAGSGIPALLGDKFHFGSCTKSMTALLAAELVVEKKIQFTTRVGDIFPNWPLDPEKSAITLDLLLQNRSGLPSHPADPLWARAVLGLPGGPAEQRKEFLREVLAAPLAVPPGTQYLYSNLGFTLAGAMLEERTQRPWEDLIRTHIFEPLGLESAGFGAPAAPGKVDQPWGHQVRGGAAAPIDPTDNPVAIAPAGRVHLSVLDAARYAAFHIQAFKGEVAALKPVRDQIYTPPPGSDYALGWIVQKRAWAGGTALTHTGSNTMFYTVIWIAPAQNMAFVVMTNIGDRAGDVIGGKCDQVVAALIKEFIQ